MPEPDRAIARRRDALWAGLAMPGVVWLLAFFLLPFYVILCVAFGTVDPIFGTPQPVWNPLEWNTSAFEFVFDGLFTTHGAFEKVFVRTFVYVAISVALSLVIAYPVVSVYPQELLVPVAGIALMALVELAFRRTLAGKALRAVAFSHDAAGLMGISVRWMITVAYALSSVLAGIAGILLAPLLNVSATMGTTIGLKAFAVAIIGGIESARGIVVAGILYGVFEAVVAGYLGTGVREILGFALVIVVLLLRPWGLFGTPDLRRV